MITIKNHILSVDIAEKGAELMSIRRDGKEYLYQGDQGWKKRSPILFPWAGRLKNLSYTYDGIEYSLPQHGFARDYTLNVEEKRDDSVTFRLDANEETMKIYPWDFSFFICYSLNNEELDVTMSVENKSGREMVFGAGIHPGFILEEAEGTVEVDAPDMNDTILNGDGVLLEGEHILDKTLPLSFFRENKTLIIPKGRKATLISGKRRITLDMDTMDNIVIWRNQEDAFLCLEAWVNLPSGKDEEENFNTRTNVQRLPSLSTWSRKCSFTFL